MLHSSHISSTTTTSLQVQDIDNQTNVFDNIADILCLLSESSSHNVLNDSHGEKGKTDNQGANWDKIPEVIQQMILKVSSTTDHCFAPGPCETYQQIVKQSKSSGATMIINVLLSTMGCQVEVTTSMANVIKTGNFRANSLQVAHPFSIFNVPYIDAANISCLNQTELELLQTEGEDIPKDIVKKLSENKFKSPTSTHLIRHQFNNWYGVLQLCFGKKALIMIEAKEWIHHIDKFEPSYDNSFKSDKDFGAKILGLVDLTFFQFCDSCL
jgi:hypothetical protein